MKSKKLGILLLIFSVIAIFGCKSRELSEPLTRNYETVDGTLKSLGGIRVNQSITNLFQDDDDKIFYAYSERYDLDSVDYMNKRIEAYGLVTTYTELDKEVFEIRSISEAPEIIEEEVKIENMEYKNENLGFKLSYQSDWEKEEMSDGVKFTAPLSGSGSTASGNVSDERDFIILALTHADINKTSFDEKDLRANEIRDFVRSNYDAAVGVASEESYLGVDKLFAVKYKAVTGDIYYFVPRGNKLYEISYYHSSTDSEKIKNSNIFSEMIADFRFIPAESNTGASPAAENKEAVKSVEPEDAPIKEEEAVQVAAIPLPTGFREFESQPYKFKILYPSAWYYSGGNYGYDFSNQPIEDESKAIIRLDLENSGSVGKNSSGDKVIITVKVGNKFYKLSATKAFESTIQIMADSIEEITE